MPAREAAIAAALASFDAGHFKRRLAELVAIPSTSQDPGHGADLAHYLEAAIAPWLQRLGFTTAIHPNPRDGFGPILAAERIEGAGPTALTYGHGDTVRGLADQWRDGLDPWTSPRKPAAGTAAAPPTTRAQHAINLHALEAVLHERGGQLGFNLKLVLETAEERGSQGLREFVAAHATTLAADVLIASDGPRVAAGTPTLSTGTRGTFHFDLVVSLRQGGVHSGNWGGMTADPAIILAHALACIADRHGRILVPGWLPPRGMPASVRQALAGLELRAESEAASIDPAGANRASPRRKRSMAGPASSCWPCSRAARKTRSTRWRPTRAPTASSATPWIATRPRSHPPCAPTWTLPASPRSRWRTPPRGCRPAAPTPPTPWVQRVAASLTRTLGRPPQLIPNSGGGLPGDVFIDYLATPLVWIPHSYNGCKQHGPDEHLLIAPAREGVAMMAGLWWDLGDPLG